VPYLDERRKLEIDQNFRQPTTPGDLNYKITSIIKQYLGNSYNYGDLNAVVGALESCKLEFYRRMVTEYEELKIKENGDVY